MDENQKTCCEISALLEDESQCGFGNAVSKAQRSGKGR